MITTHSAGWVETTNEGNWGTSHADMFLMVPDHRVAVLAPHLVNYGFVRYLMRNDWKVIQLAKPGCIAPDVAIAMVQFRLNLEPLRVALDLDEAVAMLNRLSQGDSEDGG